MGIQPRHHAAGRNAGDADYPSWRSAGESSDHAGDIDDAVGVIETPRSPTRLVAVTVAGGLIGAFAANISWLQAGPTFGFYLGPLVLAVILVPYLALMSAGEPWRHSHYTSIVWTCVGPAGFVLGVSAAWLIGGYRHEPFLTIMACCLVMLTLSLAIAEGTLLLHALTRSRLVAGFVAVVVGVAWLTWPIWVSHAAQYAGGQAWVDRLVPLHPLMVINGVIPSAGAWSQQSIAYQLTNLGQDIYYAFPASVIPCVLAQTVVAAALALLVLLGAAITRHRRR